MDGDQVDWVALAKAGDPSAMRELFERNRSRIYSLAYRYAGNSADAEDILQESFTKAFVSLAKCQLNEDSYFASWLYRIAINCSMDHFRRRRGMGPTLAVEDWPGALTEDGETPEGEFARREAAVLVRRSLGKLTRRRRMVVVLRHYQQLKIAEIAAAMGCSEGSVKRQLFQALRQLRRELHPSLGGSR